MEIKKKVSVIVPIYNTKEFLAKCLDSILQQNYPNIEIILVDNGSTDGSGIIAKEYAKKTSRIKYVYKEHGNISSARNLGLNYVEGQYVGFVDSDDWIENSMYEKLVYAMENDEADLVVCSFCKQVGEKITVMQNEKQIEENTFQNELAIKYAFVRDEYRAFCAYIWNKLFKREIIAHEKFDETIDSCEDVEFFCRMALKSKKVVYVEEPLYIYRVRENSSWNTYRYDKKMTVLSAYTKIIDELECAQINIDIISYVKRFYAYHASLIMYETYMLGEKNKLKIVKSCMKRYMKEYIFTNINKPFRIIKFLMLYYTPRLVVRRKGISG